MVGRRPHYIARTIGLLSVTLLLVGASIVPVAGSAEATASVETKAGAAEWSASDDGRTASQVASSDGDSIHRRLALSLTPETAGQIAATATFEIPSSVRGLETTLPGDATVTATHGFSKQADGSYSWDGSTANPSIRFTVPANETADGVRADGHPASGNRVRQEGSYSFVDTGPWALVSVPQLSTRWRYVGDRVALEKSISIDGEGATGGEIAFLGQHRTVEREAHDQRFELIIPEAASLQESPAEILDSTASASDALRVGDRDEHVFMVAAPTTVKWGAAGIEYGGSDYWVQADERLSDPRNVWLHEYVHTRQNYQPATGARWTTEAGAEYYAAFLTLRQDRISFATFQRHLERGTRDPVASAILADPSTWPSGTPYLKGALVFGAVDRQIRLDSNRTHSIQAVLSRMNSDPDQVTASEFYSFVETAGTANTRSYAERYAGTSAVPSTWSASEHETAFGSLPARVGYRTLDIRVTGETRNTSLTDDTVISTGETVTATVEVANTGGASSDFETTMYLDNRTVATTAGNIASEERKTVTLSHTVEQAGTYTLRVGGTTQTVVVEPPATPQVSELLVNASRDDGDWTATITVTLTNPSSRPASGSVPVTLDGREIASLDATLDANASVTRIVTTRIDPGSHTIAAGNVSTSIDVPTPTTTSTPALTPGFGISVAGIALLLAMFAAARSE